MTRHIGAALLLGAVIAPVSRFVVVQTVDWTLLEIPLSAEGEVTREFSVEKSGRYEVAITIERPRVKSSSDEAECLLGFDRTYCSGIEPLRLEWQLVSQAGGVVTVTGSSDGVFTPAAMTRSVGTFDGASGVRYAITVDVLSDATEIRSYRPRVIVIPSPVLDREEYSLTAAVWLSSLFAGLAGFLLVDRRR
jgi:hypothetical protein